MFDPSLILQDDQETTPPLPAWVTSVRMQTLEEAAFFSGAALGHLSFALMARDLPFGLLRARLALRAAQTCAAHQGRSERGLDLRDAVAFLQPGDTAGPAGELYLCWRRAAERPIAVKALHRVLPNLEAPQIAIWLDAGRAPPVARAALVLEAVLADRPREAALALILADTVLAQALGWDYMLPLLGHGLQRRDLRKTGAELRLACHLAVVAAIRDALREGAALARGAARLQAAAPKLRAKGAEAAVEMFLSQDAVAPTALTSLRSARAARRFCDRLVALGAVRELTGRDTFRLYGV